MKGYLPWRKAVAGKLHGIFVTEANLNYHGSITLDPDHCEEAGFVPMEFVGIWNKNSGARISTYIILGERGSRCCILNGAAARTCQPGDQVIICNSVYIPESQITEISPRILTFDRGNNIAERLSYRTTLDKEGRYRFSILNEKGIPQQVPLLSMVWTIEMCRGDSAVDWEKVRLFYEVAQAGNFTWAGDKLGLNQSSLSRAIAALERDLKVPLFHRHARGLILTEQGDILFRSAREVWQRLEVVQAQLTDTKEHPSGLLKVTATIGLGGTWLARRVSEFLDAYPAIQVDLILSNDELDLAMREADIAIRLRQPTQADLIQRRLFTVHYYPYASRSYLERFGEPKAIADLDHHRLVCPGGYQAGFAREDNPREPHLVVNNPVAFENALQHGAGVGMATTYSMEGVQGMVRVLRDFDWPSLDTYLAFPEEMRSVARLQVFRDFLVMKARSWAH